MKSNPVYIILTLLTFVVGFIFLHTAYFSSSQNPYAQEIILIVLGTIATILITAALINKQSELELQKEQNLKLFELKSSIYLDLINFIENIVNNEEITDQEMVKIEFLTHKISIIASPEVLKEYSHFIDVLKKVAGDHKISHQESDELSLQLAKLSVKIRQDIMNDSVDNLNELEKIIIRNVNKF
jgi:hypothetical protein